MIPVMIAAAVWLLLVLLIPFMWGFWTLLFIGGILFLMAEDREKQKAEWLRRSRLPNPYFAAGGAAEIRIVDNPDGCLDFVRHPDGKILVQTQSDKLGRLWVKYADKEILPNWSEVPSWYPVEQAVREAIERCHE
jgi:hypothetical protein